MANRRTASHWWFDSTPPHSNHETFPHLLSKTGSVDPTTGGEMRTEHRLLLALGVAEMPFPEVDRCLQLVADRDTLAARAIRRDIVARVKVECGWGR